MEKSKKVIITLSIAIVIVIVLITISFSKGAYDRQCIKKANDIQKDLYQMKGNKAAFSKSFNQGTLSTTEQKELQYFKNIINQCADLKTSYKDKLGIDVSIFESK